MIQAFVHSCFDSKRHINMLIMAVLLSLVLIILLPARLHAGWGTPIFINSNRPHTDSVALGDVNADGALDILAGDLVYINDKNGHFPEGKPLSGPSTYTGTISMALGDLNGDGTLDLLTGRKSTFSQDMSLSIRFNDGLGQFKPDNFLVPIYPWQIWSVAVGDLNDDGALDIAIGNHDQPNMIYLNKKDGVIGKFDAGSNLVVSSNYSDTEDIALGDLNGDGSLDIVASIDHSPYLIVYLNKKDGIAGRFYEGIPLNGGNGTYPGYAIALGDVNGDGALDIVNGSAVYLNNKNGIIGNFYDGAIITGGNDAFKIALGDVNSDGALDLVSTFFDDRIIVYMNDGTGHFNSHTGLGSYGTFQFALGDVNNDGALDIVTGSRGEEHPIVIILNDGQGGFNNGTPLQGIGENFAFGDVDGDGALDSVVASASNFPFGSPQPVTIFRNDGKGSFAQGVPVTTPGNINAYSVALGDVNSDDALDIVVGGGADVGADPSGKVYLNKKNGVVGNFSEGATLRRADIVAVGDVNGDGKLDIVAANYLAPSLVYLNDGQGNFSETYALASFNNTALHVALGDINGDGYLDIVIGYLTEPARIYFNNGVGGFDKSIELQGLSLGYGVALGDINGDGSLDIVGITSSQVVFTYANDGLGHFGNATPILSQTNGDHQDVELGDVNGDGTIDIAIANQGAPSIVFYNDGKGQFPTSTLIANSDNAKYIALGDVNGDGLLDMLVGNESMHLSMYLNMHRTTNILPEMHLAANALPNQQPLIVVKRPVRAGNANYYSSPQLRDEPTIPVPYTLFDQESNQIGHIDAFYSLDGGGYWYKATSTNYSETLHLSTNPFPNVNSVNTHIFNWNPFASGLFGQSDNVILRFVAYPEAKSPAPLGTYYYTSTIAGPFQWPYASATTFPFRVRGTQIQVNQETNLQAAPNAFVYRWRKDAHQATLLGNINGPYTTDLQGYLRGQGIITPTDTLVALWPVTATKAYTLYYTNITPIITGLLASTVQVPGIQKLVVSPNQPLILFNLSVSLEWDASQDQLYMDQLKADLQHTSEYLFDLTNGQAALGNLTIYQDRQHWQDADIRIYATNRLRPHATVGGMVSSLSAYTFTHTLANGAIAHTTMVYEPGQVEMGALWNRYGNIGETYSEDWPRTLAHELGHYLFRLLDNYIGLDANQHLKRIDTCPGVMSNPYFVNQSEYHPDANWSTECLATLSNQIMGESDWKTIRQFYPWLNAPLPLTDTLDSQNQGPSTLPLAVTQVSFVTPPTAKPLVDISNFTLVHKEDKSTYRAGSGARAFLFQNSLMRLVDLGAPRQNIVRSRGAREGDELCVYELNIAPAYAGCGPVTPNIEELPLSPMTGWQPDVIIQPLSAYTLNVTVTVNAPNLPLNLVARVYPANQPTSTIPAQLYTLRQSKAGAYPATPTVYAGQLTLTAPILEAYLWIYDNADHSRGLVADYALSGAPTVRLSEGDILTLANGTTVRLSEGDILRLGANNVLILQQGGHTVRLSEGDTLHLLDGTTVRLSEGDTLHLSDGTTVRLSEGDTVRLSEGDAPIRSGDGQVQIFSDNLNFSAHDFYTIQPATVLPQPPLYATQIGQAYRITASPGAPAMNNASISMYYFGRDIEPEKESLLRIYFWDEHNDPTTGRWRQLPTEVDTEHNDAIAQAQGFGLYVLMYSIDKQLVANTWNLVSYPISDTRPITYALSSLVDYQPVVYGYDADKPLFERWQLYSTKAPSWVDTLQSVTFANGYWISVTNTITKNVIWQLQDSTAAQATPLTPPAAFYGVVQSVAGFTPVEGMPVYAWVGSMLCGIGRTKAEGGQIVYSVIVYGDGADEFTGCGASSRKVHFALASTNRTRLIETTVNWSNQRPQELPLTPVVDQNELYLPVITNAAPSNQPAASQSSKPETPDYPNAIYLPLITGN